MPPRARPALLPAAVRLAAVAMLAAVVLTGCTGESAATRDPGELGRETERTLPAPPPGAPPRVLVPAFDVGDPAVVGIGADAYVVCATCHQPDGQGVPHVFPPLDGSHWVTGNPAVPIRIVLHGLQGPIEVAKRAYTGIMPPLGGTMSDAQIAAALTYARRSWGNDAAPITTAQVAAVRAETAARDRPYAPRELEPLLESGH